MGFHAEGRQQPGGRGIYQYCCPGGMRDEEAGLVHIISWTGV